MSLTSIKPASLLIHAPNWVGDHAMAFPFYSVLQKLFPEAKKYLLGRKWITSLVPPNVFNEVFVLEGKQLPDTLRQQLQKKKIEMGFTLSPSFRSAFLLKSIKIPFRIGYKTDFRSWLLHYPPQRGALRIPPYNQWEHRSLSYIRLLTPFFEQDKIAEDYWERGKASVWNFPFPKSLMQKWNKQLPKQFWVICPGSVAPSKVYPMHHLAKVIESCPRTHFVLLGSHIEQGYAKQLKSLLSKSSNQKIVDLTNQTNLLEALFILKKAKGLIANDSGLAHISFLTQTP
ncbi:MAG: lipopolysaccharide heptosyltransferase family protein, partial [Candidatus Hydrogenedentota bacterium]